LLFARPPPVPAREHAPETDPGQALTFEPLGPDAPSAQRFYSSKGAAYFHRMFGDLMWSRVVVTQGAYTDVPFFTTIIVSVTT